MNVQRRPARTPHKCAICVMISTSEALALGIIPKMKHQKTPNKTIFEIKEKTGFFIKYANTTNGNKAYTDNDAPLNV